MVLSNVALVTPSFRICSIWDSRQLTIKAAMLKGTTASMIGNTLIFSSKTATTASRLLDARLFFPSFRRVANELAPGAL